MSSEVGIDIIETARIRNVLERHEQRFLQLRATWNVLLGGPELDFGG